MLPVCHSWRIGDGVAGGFGRRPYDTRADNSSIGTVPAGDSTRCGRSSWWGSARTRPPAVGAKPIQLAAGPDGDGRSVR